MKAAYSYYLVEEKCFVFSLPTMNHSNSALQDEKADWPLIIHLATSIPVLHIEGRARKKLRLVEVRMNEILFAFISARSSLSLSLHIIFGQTFQTFNFPRLFSLYQTWRNCVPRYVESSGGTCVCKAEEPKLMHACD